jgi:predicted transposase YdaD
MDNETPSAMPENLTLTHDGYFRETFQVLRIARAILKKALPVETTACIDLEGLTVEERSLGDDMFKDTAADVIYKVPIKKRRHM